MHIYIYTHNVQSLPQEAQRAVLLPLHFESPSLVQDSTQLAKLSGFGTGLLVTKVIKAHAQAAKI